MPDNLAKLLDYQSFVVAQAEAEGKSVSEIVRLEAERYPYKMKREPQVETE